MAKKKPRTPPPRKVQAPRPVQAPRKRTDDLGRLHGRTLYGAVGVGALVIVAVVLGVLLTGGKAGAARVGSLMGAAGCSFKNVTAYVPKGQGTHVPSLTAKLPWNTNPPSNGQHYPEWAVWGFYTQAVNPRMVVHNEEHGGVILWWGSQVPSSTVSQLRAFYDQQPVGVFGTPYPSLGSKVAITAWTGNPLVYQQNGYYGEGHIAICPGYDAKTEKAFAAFRAVYRGHGPEGIPLAADHPGMGPTATMPKP